MSAIEIAKQAVEEKVGVAEDNYRRSRAVYGEHHQMTVSYRERWIQLQNALIELKRRL